MCNRKITLFDPSLWTNEGERSINLGDVIIHESVEKYLNDIFLDKELIRISSHRIPPASLLHLAKKSEIVILGGTNALSSDLKKYNQWKLPISNEFLWPMKFPVSDVILLGVGWWQYQGAPTKYTQAFYRRALSHHHLHSVRDGYTENKLRQLGFNNVLNTGCPTMWELNGMNVSARRGGANNCLFTLTDYKKSPTLDNEIIGKICEAYPEGIYFFPQGSNDCEYIASLPNFQKFKNRIHIISRSFDSYVSTLISNDVDYIGTRLHAGIKALQLNKSALILAVDNRATEISHDTGLPVVAREELDQISAWIEGASMFGKISMPVGNIELWKNQFHQS